MQSITTIGLHIAKSVFQVHGHDLYRSNALNTSAKLKPVNAAG